MQFSSIRFHLDMKAPSNELSEADEREPSALADGSPLLRFPRSLL